MAEVETLAAAPRGAAGKGPARRERRQGRVPGIIYGNDEPPLMLTLEHRRLARALADPRFFIRLVDVELEGEKHRVLPREIQYHPVSDTPIHVDFLRFHPERELAIGVPVRFEGEKESPGIKAGGILNVVRREVEVLCTADRIPSELVVDLGGLELGGSAHASSASLPDGVAFAISDRDFTIATIAAPAVIAEEDGDEEAEDGPAAETAAEPAGGEDAG